MDQLAVTAAILLVVFALHAAFAVYLYRSLTGTGSSSDGPDALSVFERADDPASDPTSIPESEPDRNANAAKDDERTVQCPNCGVRNAPEFRFCRRCVSDLSKATAPSGGRESAGLGG